MAAAAEGEGTTEEEEEEARPGEFDISIDVICGINANLRKGHIACLGKFTILLLLQSYVCQYGCFVDNLLLLLTNTKISSRPSILGD